MEKIFIKSNPTVHSLEIIEGKEYEVSFYKNTKMLIYVEGEVQVSFRNNENYALYPDGKLVPVLSPTGIENIFLKGDGKATIWGYR